jgi:hypothetical protein
VDNDLHCVDVTGRRYHQGDRVTGSAWGLGMGTVIPNPPDFPHPANLWIQWDGKGPGSFIPQEAAQFMICDPEVAHG